MRVYSVLLTSGYATPLHLSEPPTIEELDKIAEHYGQIRALVPLPMTDKWREQLAKASADNPNH